MLQKPELWTKEKVEEERGKEEQLYFAAISHYRVSRVFGIMNFWRCMFLSFLTDVYVIFCY